MARTSGGTVRQRPPSVHVVAVVAVSLTAVSALFLVLLSPLGIPAAIAIESISISMPNNLVENTKYEDGLMVTVQDSTNNQLGEGYSISVSNEGNVGFSASCAEETKSHEITDTSATSYQWRRDFHTCSSGTGGKFTARLWFEQDDSDPVQVATDTRTVTVGTTPVDPTPLPPPPPTPVPCTPSFDSASISDKVWTQYTAIAPFTLPLATGTNCSLTHTLEPPAFPNGVTLGSTLAVSGTPTVAMAEKKFTWTATHIGRPPASLTFNITVMPKLAAPTNLDVTPLPEREARLSWSAVANANGYTVQIRYPGVDWPTSSQQTRTRSTTSLSIVIDLDKVADSKGLADESYFEFQIMATDSTSMRDDSNFSETVRIIDTPIVSINGNSTGRGDSNAQARVKWSTAADATGYEVRWRSLLTYRNPSTGAVLDHKQVGWQPQPAIAWAGPHRVGPGVHIQPIDQLQMYEVYGVQLNYRYEIRDIEDDEIISSGMAFSAREAYVWPSDRAGGAGTDAGERVATFPLAHHRIQERTYPYAFCEDTFPEDTRDAWRKFIQHAFSQWSLATNDLVRAVPDGSIPCADYSQLLEEIRDGVNVFVSNQPEPPTDAEIDEQAKSLLRRLDEQRVEFVNLVDSVSNEVIMVNDVDFPTSPGAFTELSIEVGQGWCKNACYVPEGTRSFPRGDILLSYREFRDISNASGLSLPGSNSVADAGEVPFNTCDPVVHRKYGTLVHEAGHALGIGGGKDGTGNDVSHPTIIGSVMQYMGNKNHKCTPRPFDIMAIYALYQIDLPRN